MRKKIDRFHEITHLLREKRHYLCDDGVQTLRNFRLNKIKIILSLSINMLYTHTHIYIYL
jgi:hypothetical protein